MRVLDQSSFWYSKMSPALQSRASQMAARVEKRTAVTLLFLILDRFTLEMPTFSASSSVHIGFQFHALGKELGQAQHHQTHHEAVQPYAGLHIVHPQDQPGHHAHNEPYYGDREEKNADLPDHPYIVLLEGGGALRALHNKVDIPEHHGHEAQQDSAAHAE